MTTRGFDKVTGGTVNASIGVKVAGALLTALVLWVGNSTLDHGTRLTRLETRYESIAADISEIKADVKKLLENRR